MTRSAIPSRTACCRFQAGVPTCRTLLIGQGAQAPIYSDPFSYAQQWNFDIERELFGGTALSVAYAGSKGTYLPGPDQQLNQIPTEFFALGNARLQEQVAESVLRRG